MKTHEQYVKQVAQKRNDVICVGEYKGAKVKILHECMKCGNKWLVTPDHILQGTGCPFCDTEKRKAKNRISDSEYKSRLSQRGYSVIPLEPCQGGKVKITHKCLKCGYEWKISPTKVLIGKGCPICANNIKRTQEQYSFDVLRKNPFVSVLGEYLGLAIPIEHKCNICGKQWKARPRDILAGKGCPYCKMSHGEKQIQAFLEQNKILYYRQYTFRDCKSIRLLPFDFYLPDYNTCIEFQGRQHYVPIDFWGGESSLTQQKNRDSIKKDFCVSNGINLLVISFPEINLIPQIIIEYLTKMRNDCDDFDSNNKV